MENGRFQRSSARRPLCRTSFLVALRSDVGRRVGRVAVVNSHRRVGRVAVVNSRRPVGRAVVISGGGCRRAGRVAVVDGCRRVYYRPRPGGRVGRRRRRLGTRGILAVGGLRGRTVVGRSGRRRRARGRAVVGRRRVRGRLRRLRVGRGRHLHYAYRGRQTGRGRLRRHDHGILRRHDRGILRRVLRGRLGHVLRGRLGRHADDVVGLGRSFFRVVRLRRRQTLFDFRRPPSGDRRRRRILDLEAPVSVRRLTAHVVVHRRNRAAFAGSFVIDTCECIFISE